MSAGATGLARPATTSAPDARRPAILGIERSVTGRRWAARLADDRAGLALSQQLGMPEIIGRMLAGRGIGVDAAPAYLSPSLKTQLPDPSTLLDMDAAAGRLADAVEEGARIVVFGDYDVDGATSAAVLRRYFRAIGVDIGVYVPDRLAEGYGPNTAALLRLKEEGADIVITVDCGITAFEPLAAAAEAGLDVIIVDHHVAEPALPRASAIVNPNRLDDPSPHTQLAAVGVAFLLAVALNRVLRERGFFEDRAEPVLTGLLDLVALGTVADVALLTGVNRVLVSQGLKILARRQNIGMAALADVARLEERPRAWHLGFLLGPRVNAGGRVGESGLGAELLSTDDPAAARAIAERLDGYNRERQAIEAEVLEAALPLARVQAEAGAPVVLVAGEGWHPGVIGIVASRLVERLRRPVCVTAVDGRVGKGSGRSISGVDLGNAIIAARQADLLINGGGHKMAAGFTVAADGIDALREFLADRLGPSVAAAPATPELLLDGTLAVAAANRDLLAQVSALEPYGMGNPEPRFALMNARIAKADIVGGDHVRCFLGDGGIGGGGRLKAIAFRALGAGEGGAEAALGETLLRAAGGAPLHLAGRLRPDTWQGRDDVQFQIEDAAQISAAAAAGG